MEKAEQSHSAASDALTEQPKDETKSISQKSEKSELFTCFSFPVPGSAFARKETKESKLEPSPDPTQMHAVDIKIFGSLQDKMCDMTCRKCDRVPLRPMSFQCGCVYCHSCFVKITGSDKLNCSNCSTAIAFDEKKKIITAPVFMITGKLKNQKVFCEHANLGCQHITEFGENGSNLIKHLIECEYSLISCPDCNSVMSKSDFAKHKPRAGTCCPDYMETCNLCSEKYRLGDTEQHKQTLHHLIKGVQFLEDNYEEINTLNDFVYSTKVTLKTYEDEIKNQKTENNNLLLKLKESEDKLKNYTALDLKLSMLSQQCVADRTYLEAKINQIVTTSDAMLKEALTKIEK